MDWYFIRGDVYSLAYGLHGTHIRGVRSMGRNGDKAVTEAKRSLSPRQYELLELLAVKGLTVKKAAKRMNVSEGTARRTIHNMRRRLGAKTTVHAVLLGLDYIIGGRQPMSQEEINAKKVRVKK